MPVTLCNGEVGIDKTIIAHNLASEDNTRFYQADSPMEALHWAHNLIRADIEGWHTVDDLMGFWERGADENFESLSIMPPISTMIYSKLIGVGCTVSLEGDRGEVVIARHGKYEISIEAKATVPDVCVDIKATLPTGGFMEEGFWLDRDAFMASLANASDIMHMLHRTPCVTREELLDAAIATREHEESPAYRGAAGSDAS